MFSYRALTLVSFFSIAQGMQPAQRAPQTPKSLQELSIETFAKKINSIEEFKKIAQKTPQDKHELITNEALKNPSFAQDLNNIAKQITSFESFTAKTKDLPVSLYCPLIKEIVKNITESTKFTQQELLALIDKYCGKESRAVYAYVTYKFAKAHILDHITATSRIEVIANQSRKANDQLGTQVAESIYQFLEPVIEADENLRQKPGPVSPLATAQKANRPLAIEFFKEMGLKE